MKAIDFFCGAGGLTKGLSKAKINVLFGIDIDGKCQMTYEKNNRLSIFHKADIKNIHSKDLIKLSNHKKFHDFLFAGCAPCQPFSKQRKSFDRHKDFDLIKEFARIIFESSPGHIFMENVPGVIKTKDQGPLREFLNTLIKMKYKYAFGIIDAKRYGVPQTRKRFILLASKHFQPQIPPEEYGIDSAPFVTVWDAIAHFPKIKQGSKHPKIPNHSARILSELNLRRIKNTPHDGGSRVSWSDDLWLECHKKNSGYSDVYGRMKWNQPAPTLTAKCNSLSNGRYGHPEQDRAISLREAATLQSFPASYVFHGNNLHIAKQIGNAVPVKLAEVIGRYFFKKMKAIKS